MLHNFRHLGPQGRFFVAVLFFVLMSAGLLLMALTM